MDGSSDRVIKFGPFRLDPAIGSLVRHDDAGAAVPVALGARALAVLCALAGRSGELVVKQAIMDAVWPDTTVEEKNLTVQVSALRQALEREGGRGDWIQTVPGRGYRFVAPTGESQTGGEAVAREVSPVSVVALAAHSWVANSRLKLHAAWVAALMLAGVAGLGWATRSTPLPAAYSPQDRRQSIMVLPFENSSTSAAQDNVAVSVTREVVDIFARDPSVPLIPAAVAMAHRGKAIDLQRLGREHDVHFILLGNSRQQDGRLIVSATLYETGHGNQIWGQRFDRTDELEAGAWIIASLIAQSVDQATMDEEVRKALRDHPGQLDKRDLMFAAYASDMLQISKTGIQGQIALIERALALDPNYVWALRAGGRRHADLVIHGFSDVPARDAAIAAEALDRALQLAPNSYTTLKEKTYVLRAQENWLEAEALTRRLIELRPRVSARYSNLGSILMAQGRNAEALDALLASKRLQIATDDIPVVDANIAATLLATGRLREAIDMARLAIPEFTPANGRITELPWLVLIAAENASGQIVEAHADLNRFLAVPRTWNRIAAMQSVPFLRANPKMLDGIRDAGMPLR